MPQLEQTALDATQVAYEKIRAHFITSKAPGYDYKAGHCIYRGDRDPTSNCRCAFGALIPDHLYCPAMDMSSTRINSSEGFGAATYGGGLTNLLEDGNPLAPLVRHIIGDADIEFLQSAQDVHDNLATHRSDPWNANRFIDQLDELAHEYNLITPDTNEVDVPVPTEADRDELLGEVDAE